MEVELDRKAKKAVYKQIADFIEQGITSDDFLPNSKLPSERKLASKLEVNRSTVIAAYEELESKGGR